MAVENIVVILRTVFKGTWSLFELIIELEDRNGRSHCITGPEFRKLFGGSDVKDTFKLISQYNGGWEHKSHMKLTFVRFDDAQRFVDDVIAPYILIGRMINNG